MSCIGNTWGLPSRKIDPYLFGAGEIWSGEKIHRLARAGQKLDPQTMSRTGADVDVDPAAKVSLSDKPLLLTETEEDIAKIYLRYRLYTYQPDEMITMMALAGMRPGRLQLDPRLYQYGGLFIYPVGALIRLCGALGMIDVRSDLVYYLDNPDEFGKFYIVARSYSAAWGLIGVIVVFALTRRLTASIRTPSRRSAVVGASEGRSFSTRPPEASWNQESIAGLIAALFFVLMPVVVCMVHEGKPHLPGAVLMLLAVYLALRVVEKVDGQPSPPISNLKSQFSNSKFFWLMCICCGAATGMVLSSWPICVLILVTVILNGSRSTPTRINPAGSILAGIGLAVATYFATNPYVVINFFTNRDVLRSNFGNSLAMYEIARIGEGFVRVIELTAEGATLAIAFLGILALVLGLSTRARRVPAFWLLVIPALAFFVQFVLIGAGKPPEYGRFGIFTNAALAIGAAFLLSARWSNGVAGILVFCAALLLVAVGGLQYLFAFQGDAARITSRIRAADQIAKVASTSDLIVVVAVEPAPYSCPPINFAKSRVLLANEPQLSRIPEPSLLVHIDDRMQRARISWANKRVSVRADNHLTWFPPLNLDTD